MNSFTTGFATMRFLRELLISFVCISEASVIPISLRSEDNLAPLYKGISDDIRPDSYMVTLYRNINYTYHDHFKTIGRNLEADNSTAFRWFELADSYYATNISSDWVCSYSNQAQHPYIRLGSVLIHDISISFTRFAKMLRSNPLMSMSPMS